MNATALSILPLLVALAAGATAQGGPLGAPAPALAIDKCVTGKAPTQYTAGQVYLVEFWGVAPDFGIERRRDYERLAKQHEGKLQLVALMYGTETFGYDEVKAYYEEFGKDIAFCIGWDEGGKRHGAWPISDDVEPPVVFLVDQQGRLMWTGGFSFVPLVLPAVLAGDADPAALAKATTALEQKLVAVYLAAGLEPAKAIELLDALLLEFPFLAESVLPQVFGTMLEEGHRDVAMTLAKRVCDVAIANDDAELLNGLAWVIVDPEVQTDARDLALAERAAKKAVELTKEKDANVLDTMARVCCCKKDYAGAVSWQKKALAVVDEDEEEMRDVLMARLAEYEALAGKK